MQPFKILIATIALVVGAAANPVPETNALGRYTKSLLSEFGANVVCKQWFVRRICIQLVDRLPILLRQPPNVRHCIPFELIVPRPSPTEVSSERVPKPNCSPFLFNSGTYFVQSDNLISLRVELILAVPVSLASQAHAYEIIQQSKNNLPPRSEFVGVPERSMLIIAVRVERPRISTPFQNSQHCLIDMFIHNVRKFRGCVNHSVYVSGKSSIPRNKHGRPRNFWLAPPKLLAAPETFFQLSGEC
ncbi:hypothetical protein C8R45DRAFT_945947 [Mycena sanguinolenta]|nr:hypothetical protein C8R45DRAFT_945947 [Mycena sanguinolenta]